MIPTGSIGIDNALGGGLRPGTMNEIWGEPGSAKTVLALHTVESVVRTRKQAVWVDLDDGVRHMVTAPRVIVAQTRVAEQVFLIAHAACDEPDIALVVIDPTQYLVRQRELDGDPDYVPHPQREYRVELSALKKHCALTGTTVLFVSQPRNTERQPVRGTGISEKVEYRVILHPDVVHQDGTREIQASVKHVPGKTVRHEAARFTVIPGKGIDQERELVTVGVDVGVVRKSGSWLRYRNLSGQGTDNLATALRAHPQFVRQLYADIRADCAVGVAPSRGSLITS